MRELFLILIAMMRRAGLTHTNLLALLVTFYLTACGGGAGGQGASSSQHRFMVGGIISGLAAGSAIKLAVNGTDITEFQSNGSFQFSQSFASNSAYAVTVVASPSGQSCSVASGSGIVTSNVTDVTVTCAIQPAPSGSITGTVSGNSSGSKITLLNNGADSVAVEGAGQFGFTVAAGTSYSISVQRNPLGYFCGVSNGVGIVGTTFASVQVNCRPSRLSVVTGFGGGPGYSDGTGNNARFNRPAGIAIDAGGNAYVADSANALIRKISPDGIVTTIAGAAGTDGSVDGPGPLARFRRPTGIVVDGTGNLYVSEDNTVRKITPAGVVSTFAGSAGQLGAADGTGTDARFRHLMGIAIDEAGYLYVTDDFNQNIRKISPAGVVTTFAGQVGQAGYVDGAAALATFSGPSGIAVDRSNNVYVVDAFNRTVRKITPAGIVSTVAGVVGTAGNNDGAGSAAMFHFADSNASSTDQYFNNSPIAGIVVDEAGTLYVTDYYNNSVRKISSNGSVSTLVGGLGYLDGPNISARLRTPTGIARAPSGEILVAEDFNYTIRKLSPALNVTTLAGRPLVQGHTDGPPGTATFNFPRAVAADATGNIYVADRQNGLVRKIAATSGTTSTLAGKLFVEGSNDSTFFQPNGIAVDNDGNVYVSDLRWNNIRKISSNGVTTILAGSATGQVGRADGVGTAAQFFAPAGLATDDSGNVYVADQFNRAVRKIAPNGLVTTLSTDFAYGPTGVSLDRSGNIFVVAVNVVIKLTPDGHSSILAGNTNRSGSADGIGSMASFTNLDSVAVDNGGNVFVSDSGNCTVRMITSTGVVSTVAGISDRCEVHEGDLPGLVGILTGLALAPNGQLIISANNAVLRLTGF